MADRQVVLLIEDNPGDVRLIREMLAEGEDALFELACVGRLSQGLEYLATRSASLVLLDLSLPDSYGFDTFLKVYAHSPKVPIIVLTGYDDQTVALSAVKTGAQDYLVKGKLDRELLLRSMQYSIERKRYQEQLEFHANFDALTGLPNRNLLHDRLRQSVFAQRYVRSIGLVFLDVDHFKFVNDSLGHNTGDKLLQQVAVRLTQTVRDGDTVARLGGDEFILILSDQPGQEVIYRAMQRILSKVRADQRRRARAAGDLQRGYQPLSAGRPGRGDAAQERRRGDVPREGEGTQQFPVLHRGDEPAGERAAADGGEPAAGARAQGVRALLPAARQREKRGAGELRGAAALAASGTGAAAARALHPARRGDGAHRADRRVGAEERLLAGEDLAERQILAGLGVGQSLLAPVQGGSPRERRQHGAKGERARSVPARDGADREPGDARHRRRDPGAYAPARNRRRAFGGRLW